MCPIKIVACNTSTLITRFCADRLIVKGRKSGWLVFAGDFLIKPKAGATNWLSDDSYTVSFSLHCLAAGHPTRVYKTDPRAQTLSLARRPAKLPTVCPTVVGLRNNFRLEITLWKIPSGWPCMAGCLVPFYFLVIVKVGLGGCRGFADIQYLSKLINISSDGKQTRCVLPGSKGRTLENAAITVHTCTVLFKFVFIFKLSKFMYAK